MARVARSTINRKLTITIIATTGGALLLACLMFLVYDVITLRQRMIERVETRALREAVALLRNHAGSDGEQ